jgi:hypothetical protein
MKLCCYCLKLLPKTKKFFYKRLLRGKYVMYSSDCKKCHSIRSKIRSIKNRAHILERQKKYRENNRDKIKLRNKIYGAKNRDKITRRTREWRRRTGRGKYYNSRTKYGEFAEAHRALLQLKKSIKEKQNENN